MSASGESRPGTKWAAWRVVLYALLICGAYLFAQTAAFFAIVSSETAAAQGKDAGAWASNGLVLAACTIAAALVCVPLMGYLAGRREEQPWAYLGIRPFRRKSLLLWCVVMILFLACSDLASVALGRPLVPQFMIDAYESAGYPVLLAFALLVAAPLVEELFFRGFVISACGSLGVPFRIAATGSALAWAAIHSQYDLYDMSQVFLMGLLFT